MRNNSCPNPRWHRPRKYISHYMTGRRCRNYKYLHKEQPFQTSISRIIYHHTTTNRSECLEIYAVTSIIIPIMRSLYIYLWSRMLLLPIHLHCHLFHSKVSIKNKFVSQNQQNKHNLFVRFVPYTRISVSISYKIKSKRRTRLDMIQPYIRLLRLIFSIQVSRSGNDISQCPYPSGKLTILVSDQPSSADHVWNDDLSDSP